VCSDGSEDAWSLSLWTAATKVVGTINRACPQRCLTRFAFVLIFLITLNKQNQKTKTRRVEGG
jgi:hypothetical protein